MYKKYTKNKENFGAPCALCYGSFKVIHPGHLAYLKMARSLASSVVVVVRHESSMSQIRENLLHLDLVDHVLVMDESAELAAIVRELSPRYVVLGEEFRDGDRKKEVVGVDEVVGEYGGELIFAHSGRGNIKLPIEHESNSATKWVYPISDSFAEYFRATGFSQTRFEHVLSNMNGVRVLVFGDLIVDEYKECRILGLSSEAPIPVVTTTSEQRFIGGAGVIAKLIPHLGGSCTFASIVGTDSIADEVRESLSCLKELELYFLDDESRKTTLKTRYVAGAQKLLRVSSLDSHNISTALEKKMIGWLNSNIDRFDAVIVSDFSYGVVTPPVINHLIKLKREYDFVLAGDSQTGSQIGYLGKFRGFDLLTPNELEARQSVSGSSGTIEVVANQLKRDLAPGHLMVTLGRDGFLSYNDTYCMRERDYVPAAFVEAFDPAGCGDSLLSIATICQASGVSRMDGLVLCGLVSGLASQSRGATGVDIANLRNLVQVLER